jgi:4,5-DOPA dioxygenase extradiol
MKTKLIYQICKKQETIYDFYGFPNELYEVKYEPEGSANFTKEVKNILKESAHFAKRGLDHGAWSVLHHMYPNQDIPTFQISMNKNLNYEEHFNIGKMLNTLRQQGVLVIGSGGSVHNLRALKRPPFNPSTDIWADEFDSFVKNSFDNKNFNALIEAKFHKYFNIAHPYDDHFIPMLYVAGLVNSSDKIEHFYEGMDLGNLSMRCIKVG